MTDPHMSENETGQEIVEHMDPAARARAEEELSHLALGPHQPLHFGHKGLKTQLDEDPISEVAPFRESLP